MHSHPDELNVTTQFVPVSLRDKRTQYIYYQPVMVGCCHAVFEQEYLSYYMTSSKSGQFCPQCTKSLGRVIPDSNIKNGSITTRVEELFKTLPQHRDEQYFPRGQLQKEIKAGSTSTISSTQLNAIIHYGEYSGTSNLYFVFYYYHKGAGVEFLKKNQLIDGITPEGFNAPTSTRGISPLFELLLTIEGQVFFEETQSLRDKATVERLNAPISYDGAHRITPMLLICETLSDEDERDRNCERIIKKDKAFFKKLTAAGLNTLTSNNESVAFYLCKTKIGLELLADEEFRFYELVDFKALFARVKSEHHHGEVAWHHLMTNTFNTPASQKMRQYFLTLGSVPKSQETKPDITGGDLDKVIALLVEAGATELFDGSYVIELFRFSSDSLILDSSQDNGWLKFKYLIISLDNIIFLTQQIQRIKNPMSYQFILHLITKNISQYTVTHRSVAMELIAMLPKLGKKTDDNRWEIQMDRLPFLSKKDLKNLKEKTFVLHQSHIEQLIVKLSPLKTMTPSIVGKMILEIAQIKPQPTEHKQDTAEATSPPVDYDSPPIRALKKKINAALDSFNELARNTISSIEKHTDNNFVLCKLSSKRLDTLKKDLLKHTQGKDEKAFSVRWETLKGEYGNKKISPEEFREKAISLLEHEIKPLALSCERTIKILTNYSKQCSSVKIAKKLADNKSTDDTVVKKRKSVATKKPLAEEEKSSLEKIVDEILGPNRSSLFSKPVEELLHVKLESFWKVTMHLE